MSMEISEIKLSPSGTKRGQLKFDRIFWSFPISDDTLHVHNCTPALPILEAKMSFANIRKVARHLGSSAIRLASEYAPVVALEASGIKHRAAKDGSEAAETLVTLPHQCVHWPG